MNTHTFGIIIAKKNPELWEKGKSILKDTYYWNEVKSDPNYTDIADNDDLVLRCIIILFRKVVQQKSHLQFYQDYLYMNHVYKKY